MSKEYYIATIYSELFTDGPYNTVEEATAAAIDAYDLKKGDFFELGEKASYEPSLNMMWPLDSVREHADEECGIAAEDWLIDVPRKEEENLEEMLNDAFIKWLKKTDNMPRFFKIINIKTIEIK